MLLLVQAHQVDTFGLCSLAISRFCFQILPVSFDLAVCFDLAVSFFLNGLVLLIFGFVLGTFLFLWSFDHSCWLCGLLRISCCCRHYISLWFGSLLLLLLLIFLALLLWFGFYNCLLTFLLETVLGHQFLFLFLFYFLSFLDL